MLLVEIKQKVQSILDNSNKEVVMGVYQNMIKSHNDFCSCNYCNILREYVSIKKHICRFKRNSDDIYDSEFFFNKIETDKKRIKELKKLKDDLKKL